ncbi:3-hydroxyisobutyryl-CoA hydrolase, mitochondrial-like [Actinia tenebrosa]|uniref:3-hydroxyisobutyryl-CoA hydrolase, mitochondrial n=1 Tax=Actinia tenebrosa TaxID=6105 RepID=A0A6P8HL99_ACTTE|nr:3-hydroxyisobutyryl-CoA hydrolase, mitochondrial-like [Actinia tenebrosa]
MYPLRLFNRVNIVSCRVATLAQHLRMSSSSASSTKSIEDVFMEIKDQAGIITLNRPKALNALNLSMVRKIYPVLKSWEADPKVNLVIIKATGDKAFCAGGDVRAIAEDGLRGGNLPKDFFKEEYMLNYAIGTLQTPYVALIHGITMGGGVGLSVHGHFRVATEKTLFAMPETAIGLFPDVGGGHALPRLEGNLGIYLALTGFRLRGYDVKHAGIATHFVKAEKLSELESSLLGLSDCRLQTVRGLLDDFDKECSKDQNPNFTLQEHMDKINSCFDKNTVEDIMSSLEKNGSEWANKQIETINKMSPSSCKVTLRQLREGARMNLADCLQMEYRISQRFMENEDFYEGIRAVLVDKDNSPRWKPSTLQGVSNEKVDSYFLPLGERDLVL